MPIGRRLAPYAPSTCLAECYYFTRILLYFLTPKLSADHHVIVTDVAVMRSVTIVTERIKQVTLTLSQCMITQATCVIGKVTTDMGFPSLRIELCVTRYGTLSSSFLHLHFCITQGRPLHHVSCSSAPVRLSYDSPPPSLSIHGMLSHLPPPLALYLPGPPSQSSVDTINARLR